MPNPAPHISLIVPVYNQAEALGRLLASFEKLLNADEVEILIVDDCSTDDTPALAQAWIERDHPFDARYLRMEQNGGPGRARNAGLRAARAPIVAFTDSDCIAEPDWLIHLTKPLDTSQRIAGVGGKVLPLTADSMTTRYYVFNRALEPPVSIQYLVTCNCCYLREELLSVGGFTEDIRTAGGEDIAASILLWKSGWRFAYAPGAIIHHDFRSNLRNFFKTWRNYGYGCGLVAHRHLTKYELHPEWGIGDAENYWNGLAINPTVTGLRSFWRDFLYHWNECRTARLTARRTLEEVLLRTLARIAYFHGFKQGAARHAREASFISEK